MSISDKRQKQIAQRLFATLRDEARTPNGRVGAPVRRSFVLRQKYDPSPLVRLLNQRNGKSGGPGGGLRLQIYLSLLWVCASKPYETQRPARVWAELLSLEDPDRNGTRRVRAALKELSERGFIRVEATKPTPTIKLLSDLGDGSEYIPPGIAILQSLPEERATQEYFRVPNAVWLEGYIGDMNGAALAMLLILLAESRGTRRDVWLSPKALEHMYGISPSTRTKGIAQLKELGLITIQRQAMEPAIEFSPSRQIYQVPLLPEPESHP